MSENKSEPKILIAESTRFVPAEEKLTYYQRKIREQQKKEQEKALDNTNTLFKNASSSVVTPVKNIRKEPKIFTPGGYDPMRHDLVEMPSTPKLGTSLQKLDFNEDFNEDSHGGLFLIDPNDEIFKSQEKGGRKRRKSRKLGKSPKKSRKSKRKTTRKLRRHRRR